MSKNKIDLVKMVRNSGICLTQKGIDTSVEEVDRILGVNPRPATIGSHIIQHDEIGQRTIPRSAIYNMRVYPAGFSVQEKDKDKMRLFWKELGVIV